ncbi:MAG: hypothetical protein BGP04_20270 [Rhizobiales bacterium 62-17]|nr:DUF2628 domain-containing protein [Hyphomicrobiales bacterium]OJX99973.1 MAG: hypothetical protein BGP04_20270 [Rhizobiales bacterium 62-17]
MPVFTIHTPSASPSGGDPAAGAVFVREGFSRLAFLFGPLWLLWNRRWLAFGLWFLAFACVFFAIRRLGFSPALMPAYYFGVGLLLGLEAPVLRRAALAGRGFSLSDIAVAENLREAEITWFARRRSATVPASALAPTLTVAVHPARAVPPVGLFPDVPSSRP